MKSRFKISIIIAFVMIMAILLTGCMQYVIQFDVATDMSATIDIKVGIQHEAIQSLKEMGGEEDPFEDADEEAEKYGLSVSPYNDGSYEGVEMTGTIDDITNPGGIGALIGTDQLLSKTTENGKEILNIHIPTQSMSNSMTSQTGTSIDDMQSYGKMDCRIVFTLPYPVTETNATEVSSDKKTLTWDLLTFKEDTMMAKAPVGGAGFPIWVIIVIIIVAVAIVAFLFLKSRKKKKETIQNENQGGYAFDPMTGEPVNNSCVMDNTESFHKTEMASVETAETEKKISQDEDKINPHFCGVCGAPLTGNEGFCGKCGSQINKQTTD